MKNVFNVEDAQDFISRIDHLSPSTAPQWGTMTASQMLAHCNVPYEMIYENIHPTPNFFKKLIMKLFVKKHVVGHKPYPHNAPTAPQFIIKEDKNFDIEKERLINYIHKTQQLGEAHFDQKESPSFGKLTKTEWNNMLYKHLDHLLSIVFGINFLLMFLSDENIKNN